MNPKVPPLYQGPLGSVSCAFDGILKRNYARMLFVSSSEEHQLVLQRPDTAPGFMHYPPRIPTQGWLPEFVTTSLGVTKDRHGAPELQRP